ncbi:MAG: hypothetical protein EHM90_05430, partial [Chloroflexi bacterium]
MSPPRSWSLSTKPGSFAGSTTTPTRGWWRPSCSRSSESPCRPRPMLAARTHAAGEPLRLEDVPVPAPRGTEVLIRVAGAGVCHTDLHIARTDRIRVERPVTLGHEVAGWIAGMGADAGAPLRKARLKEDEPVVVAGGWGCGECAECRRGEEQRCEFSRAPGFQVDGGYAEYLLVPHPRHLVSLGKLDPVDAAPL